MGQFYVFLSIKQEMFQSRPRNFNNVSSPPWSPKWSLFIRLVGFPTEIKYVLLSPSFMPDVRSNQPPWFNQFNSINDLVIRSAQGKLYRTYLSNILRQMQIHCSTNARALCAVPCISWSLHHIWKLFNTFFKWFWALGYWGSIPSRGWEFFSSPPRPNRL
jgi:hypothetical protein